MADLVLCDKDKMLTLANAYRTVKGETKLYSANELIEKASGSIGTSEEKTNVNITINWTSEAANYNPFFLYQAWKGPNANNLSLSYEAADTSGSGTSGTKVLQVAKGGYLSILCRNITPISAWDTYGVGSSGYITLDSTIEHIREYSANGWGITNGHFKCNDTGTMTIKMTYQTCCFVAGTQVLSNLSGETKSIEKFNAGDSIVSYDINANKPYLAEVEELVLNKHSLAMATITFENGTTLEMTDYHPIYTKEGWCSLTDPEYKLLIVGMEAKTIEGWSKIASIDMYKLVEPITTYTLRVHDYNEQFDNDINDNYFANGIMVHNAGCK